MTVVELDIEGPRARITLANPAGRNAIGREFCEQFAAAALRCASDPAIRVVTVRALGEMFSVGGDLKEFMAWGAAAGARVHETAELLHEGVSRLHQGDAAVILALNGMAAGAGFSLVCGADLVVAARSARLTSAYTKMGLSPDGGGTWFLPRIVGTRRAFALMSLNTVLDAEQAKAIGLVTEVVDDERLDAAMEEMAQRLLALPGGALRRLKRLLAASHRNGLDDHLAVEGELIGESAGSPEVLAAMAAFFQRSAG